MLFYIIDINGNYTEIIAENREQAEYKMHNMFSDQEIEELEMEIINPKEE